MTFEETLDVFKGLSGRPVDISAHIRGLEHNGVGGIVSFSGVVDRLAESVGGRWRLWLKGDDVPGPVCVLLDPEIFDGAEVVADSHLSMEEVIAEGADQSGTTWTIWIRQGGIVTEIMVYV